MPDKVIPILPCPDIRAQVAFYEQLGFEVAGLYTSPNPYAVLRFGTIEIHFYGTKKIAANVNSSMCYISVDDVDAIYGTFATAFKKHLGKVPRSGLPRISKVHDLKEDRRFTMTDPGGNTFYIGSPVKGDATSFFRTLQDTEWSKKFAVLYDVIYSKEDPEMAMSMLPKFEKLKESPNDLDRAKYLLLTLEIAKLLGQPGEDGPLKKLTAANKGDTKDWPRIKERYKAILKGE